MTFPRFCAALFCAALLLPGPAAPRVLNAPRDLAEYSGKTLFTSFGDKSPRTLDPQASYTSNESPFTQQIYEPLYQYHFLKRPFTIEPKTALELAKPLYLDREGRPASGTAAPKDIGESVYTIRIKKGILFAPHPAFARDASGRHLYFDLPEEEAKKKHSPADFEQTGTRELTAEDYVWGFKRLASPQVVSPILSTLAQYVVGLDELARTLAREEKACRESNSCPPVHFLDLARHELAGVRALDRYTLEIRVRGKYPQFDNWLTMAFTAPVPWEADRFYAQEAFVKNNFTLSRWPVGTGPFMMARSEENRLHEMVKNPNYRFVPYPCVGEPEDEARGFLRDCGKPLPRVDRIVFEVEKESVPLQSKFLQGYYDSPSLESVTSGLGFLAAMADDPKKAALYREKKLQFPESVGADLRYLTFNWLDPVVGGGHTPEEARRARLLRQAISIALDNEEMIAIFQKNQGRPANGPVPPGLFGYREDGPEAMNTIVYERDQAGVVRRRPIEEARRLMAEAGYPEGRDARTGEPLVLSLDYQSAAQGSKAFLEWHQRQFAKLGIQLDIRATDYNRFQEKLLQGSFQVCLLGWLADYPDAENFLFLFYGPNAKAGGSGGENTGNYVNPEYDRLFEAMKYLEDGPEKADLIDRMVRILQEDAPSVFTWHPLSASAFQEWVTNAKPSMIIRDSLIYLGVDPKLRARRIAQWNEPVLWPLALLLAGLALLLLGVRSVWRARGRAVFSKEVEGDAS